MERFNLKRSNDVEVKEEYEVNISNRFATSENLNDGLDLDISRGWKSVRENMKASATESLGHYELKQHKP